jgi:hypothetical protein
VLVLLIAGLFVAVYGGAPQCAVRLVCNLLEYHADKYDARVHEEICKRRGGRASARFTRWPSR